MAQGYNNEIIVSKRSRSISTWMVFLASVFLTSSALSNPVLDNIASGNVTIQQSPNSTVVNQASDKAIINWQSFNIGAQESTHFQQPTGGVALNRINAAHGASQIYGSLTATGRIILVNSAGIFFGPSAYVNVGGLIASTASITDQSFLSGHYQFELAPGAGSVINQGVIVAAQNGVVALIGNGVQNDGYVEANLGHVILASGETPTISFAGSDMLSFSVSGTASKGIRNKGTLKADGGVVRVHASVASNTLDNVINMEGVAQARGLYQQGGTIILSSNADAGNIRVSGKLDASGKGKGLKGGNITITGHSILLDDLASLDVSGDIAGGTVYVGGNFQGKGPLANAYHVEMRKNAVINADALSLGHGGEVILWADNSTKAFGTITVRGGLLGGDGGLIETSGKKELSVDGITVALDAPNGFAGNWLLDPENYVITDATTIMNALNSGNVTIQTYADALAGDGDIIVNDAITWSTNNKLTLTAYRNIDINAAISNAVGGDLTLLADNTGTGIGTINGLQTSGSGSLNFSGNNSVVKAYYNPTNYPTPDSDRFTNVVVNGSGSSFTPYMLIRDINQLQSINNNLGGNYALSRDIDASITSTWNNGAGFAPIGVIGAGLAGSFDGLDYTISNLYINRPSSTGIGLFAQIDYGASVQNLGLIAPNVTGAGQTGSLVYANNGLISNVYAINPVVYSTGFEVGGLVGRVWNGSITDSYVSGATVTGFTFVGGLAGFVDGAATISNSYANANVIGTGLFEIGGFVGTNWGMITNSHSTGSVTATGALAAFDGNLGGFAGANPGIIQQSYSTANVTVANGASPDYQSNSIGGFVGSQWTSGARIIDSYSTGNVSAPRSFEVGGLIGRAWDGSITGSYASGGTVTGFAQVGGLAGFVDGVTTISNSHSSANVTGTGLFDIGGFVGINWGTISNAYSTGSATANGSVAPFIASLGGFAGSNPGTIQRSYSSGDVTLANGTPLDFEARAVGGFVGALWTAGARVIDSYSTGNVSANLPLSGFFGGGVGGFVGTLDQDTNFTAITRSYSTGSVSNTSTGHTGGFIGNLNAANGMILNSFYDSQTSGKSNAYGNNNSSNTVQIISATTSQLMELSTFANSGWLNESDITSSASSTSNAPTATWFVFQGATRPLLMMEYSTDITNTHQLQLSATTLGASYTQRNALDLSSATNKSNDVWGGVGNISAANLSSNHSIALGSSSLTLINTVNSTISGTISGSGRIIKAGENTLTLSAANTYSGGTTIHSGVLSINADNRLGAAPGVSTPGHLVINNGALATTASFVLNPNRGITLSGTGGIFTPNAGTTLTYNGVITGSGALSITGAGTLSLSGVNTYTGNTNISTGTLMINSDAALGGAFASNSVVLDNNGTLIGSTGVTLNANRGITIGSNGGALGRMTVPSIVSGDGSLTIKNNNVKLSGINTYTGNTIINSNATLQITEDVNLGAAPSTSTPDKLVLNGGVLQWQANLTLNANRGISVMADSTVVGDSGRTLTYGGSLSGSGKISTQGIGTLSLTGDNSNAATGYSGVWNIVQGTVIFASDAAIGIVPTVATPGQIVLNFKTAGNGIGSSSSFTIHPNRGITLETGGGRITPNSGTTLTYEGIIDGVGSLAKQGAGTLVLGGTNTYTGITSLNGGVLSINSEAALGALPNSFVANQLTFNSGTLAISDDISFSSNRGITLTGAGTLSPTAGTTLTYDGIITGAGALTKAGAGVAVLTGTNTYTGVTNINGGTLQISSDANLGTAPTVATTGKLTFSNGGTLSTTNNLILNTFRGVTLNGSGGAFNPIEGTTLTYSGIIAGAGSLSVNNSSAGTVVLSGANTYSGTTNINGGVLQISADNNLGAAPGTLTANKLTLNGGTLATTASFTLNTNRGVTLNSEGGTFSTNPSTTLTYNGVISGSGSLGKQNTGTLALGGANTYSGITHINNGFLSARNATALGSTAAGTEIASTGALEINNVAIGNEALTLSGNGYVNNGIITGVGTASIAGDITLTANAKVRTPGTLTFSGNISETSGSSLLNTFGVGTIVLAGTNTYTGGTLITQGTTRVTSVEGLGTGAVNIVGNVGTVVTLDLSSLSDLHNTNNIVMNSNSNNSTARLVTSNSLSLNNSITLVNNNNVVSVNDNTTTFTGLIDGSGSLTKAGSGTLSLTNDNSSYTGKTTISSGILSATSLADTGSNSALGAGSSIVIGSSTSAGVLSINASSASTNREISLAGASTIASENNGNLSFSGNIDGAKSLSIDTGTGSVTLLGAIGSTAPLTTLSVNSGQINLANSVATDGSSIDFFGAVNLLADVSVSNSGAINYNNTVDGAYTLNSFSSNDNVTFADAIGSQTPLAELQATGTQVVIESPSIATTGSQTYTGPVSLNENTVLSSENATINIGDIVANGNGITFTAPVVLLADTNITDSGAIHYMSSVNGAYHLNVNSTGSTVMFDGPIGDSIALASLDVTGTSITLNGGNIHTSGLQTYRSPVILGADTAMVSDAGPIQFASTIDGAKNLSVNSGVNSFSFGGAIGSMTPLDQVSLSTSSSSDVNINHSIHANKIHLSASNARIVLGAGLIADASDDAINLNAQSFTNNAGANAFNTANGRFLVWSTNPMNDVRGDIAYHFKQYNAMYGSSTVLGSGSGFLYSTAPVITASLTGSVSKVYDATTAASLSASNYAASGMIDGDVITFNNPMSGSYDTKNVGANINVSVSDIQISNASNQGVSVYGYQLSSNSANADIGVITPYALSINAIGADKVYDATTSASVSLSTNQFAGDDLSASHLSASFADKNVGVNKAISVSGISLSGSDAANYSFNDSASTAASITPFTLTVSALGSDKVYDANTSASVSLSANTFAGDDLSASYLSANFADKNVGVNKAISVSGISLSGSDAANYSFNDSASTAASITPFALTVSASGSDKVYDATTSASVNISANSFSGDDLSLSYDDAGFTDKHAGLNKSISISGISLSGNDAGNYMVVDNTITTAANITPATLTVIANSGLEKVYGTNDPTFDYSTSGLYDGDSITGSLSRPISLATQQVGSYDINIGTLSAGSDYTINYQSASFAIKPASLSVIADAATKIQGEAEPALTYQTSGLVNHMVDGVMINDSADMVLTGSLARDPGESIGNYNITQGTLTTASSNYELTNVTGNTLTVVRGLDTYLYTNADLPTLSNGVYQVTALRNIFVAGNINVGSHILSLDAGSNQPGSISELSAGIGTLTANTIKMGSLLTTTNIGSASAPIMTSAMNLYLNASGDVFVANTAPATSTVNLNGVSRATVGHFNITANDSSLSVKSINTNGANVTIQSSKNLLIDAPITFSTPATFTAKAGESITVSHSINTNGAVTLDADMNNTGTGKLVTNALIKTNGSALTYTAGLMDLNATIDTKGGLFTLNATGSSSTKASLGFGEDSNALIQLTKRFLTTDSAVDEYDSDDVYRPDRDRDYDVTLTINGPSIFNAKNGIVVDNVAVRTKATNAFLTFNAGTGDFVVRDDSRVMSSHTRYNKELGNPLTVNANNISIDSTSRVSAGSGTMTLNATNTITLANDMLSRGTQIYNGNIVLADHVTFKGTHLLFNGSLTGAGKTLTLKMTGIATQTGDLSVGTFALKSGAWLQNNTALPSFNTQQFQLNDGTIFLRAAGGAGTTSNPFIIKDVYGLQGAGTLLYASYALGNNIDASAAAQWNNNKGFDPIGSYYKRHSDYYMGTFDGRGNTISNLRINLPGSDDGVGLFGILGNTGVVKNLNLTNVSITGQRFVGGIAGYSLGAIQHVNVQGTIDGNRYSGGIVGYNDGGSISHASAAGYVIGGNMSIGGIVGFNASGTISNVTSTANVTGKTNVGGLIGENLGLLSFSSAMDSTISGTNQVGGLVGSNDGTISDSTSTNQIIIGNTDVGGIAGINDGTIQNSTASDNTITGKDDVGGIAGENNGIIMDSTAFENLIKGMTDVGGIAGENNGTIINSDAIDNTITGKTRVGGLAGFNADDALIAGSLSSDNTITGTKTSTGTLVGTNDGGTLTSNTSTDNTVTLTK